MKLPDVTIRAEAYKDEIVVPITLLMNYPRNNFDPVYCGIIFDDKTQSPSVIIEDNSHYYQIRTKNSFKQNIWIPRFRRNFQNQHNEYGLHNRAIHGFAELYVEGNLDNFTFGNNIKAYVFLQDNPFFRAHDDEKPIHWYTPFGAARIVYDYRYGGRIRDMSEIIPLKQHFIELTIDTSNYNSAYKLIIDIEAYLDEIMYLFWFLGKKYLFWHKIEMYDAAQIPIILYKDARIVTRNKIEIESAIWQNDPRNLIIDINKFESLGTIFNEFLQSENKLTIKKIITFLMTTYLDAYIESDLSFIYTALEIIIDQFTEPNIIDNKILKQLKSSMKRFLNEQKEIQLSDSQIKAIEEKLPELQRLSFRTRLDELLKTTLNSPIFIPNYSYTLTQEFLLKRIGEAVSRRNKYIHKGYIANYAVAMNDIAAIRFVINLWILTQLNYSLDNINPYDSDVSEIISELKRN